MKCKYITLRKKKNVPYFFCRLDKRQIIPTECKNCSKSILKTNKPIKKVSKQREFVKKDTYEQVLNRDKRQCRLCSTTNNLELHHIIYRSEDKSKINDINNCIMLCNSCHKLVHSNKKKYKEILIKILGGKKNEIKRNIKYE